jgi:hypothetical protein
MGVKLPGREADHSLPSMAEVKECVVLYLHPQYVFMAWCLVKHRDTFTLLYLPNAKQKRLPQQHGTKLLLLLLLLVSSSSSSSSNNRRAYVCLSPLIRLVGASVIYGSVCKHPALLIMLITDTNLTSRGLVWGLPPHSSG